MSNLEKKKTTEELLAELNANITWRDGRTIPVGIGDWLEYDGGFYKVVSIEETENGIYLNAIDEDGKDEKYIRQFQYYNYIGTEEYKKQIITDTEDIFNGKTTIKEISQRLENSNESSSNELMVMNTNVLLEKKKHLESVQTYLKVCSKRAENALKARMSGLYELVDGFKKTVAKIQKLIFTLELYEGLSEEIHHIKVGANAKESEILTLRQRKLFMDEEVGDPTDDGLDFKNIEDFDNWLLEKNEYWNCYNYEFIIPEEKCVVALGIRRSDKNYSDNPFINSMINDSNKWCYLLIRNGENLYRIYSDLRIGETMFPQQTELMKLQEEYETTSWSSKKEDIDNQIDRYKFNMILLQGIIERTQCYPDEKYTLSLFKMHEGSRVKFLYDAEESKLLTGEKQPFWDWVKEKNEGTDVGSQILWFNSSIDFRKETDRMFREPWRRYKEHYPNNPGTGVYQLETAKHKSYYSDEKDILFFKYDPERYNDSWWYEENDKPRVKRVSFIFETYDSFINYDNITREDIPKLQYYIHTRVGRRFYLTKIPILLEVTKRKINEFAEEDNFIKLALTQAGLNTESNFKKGADAMHWWKTKNKWKRTLTTDDSKALRMIVKELKKK